MGEVLILFSVLLLLVGFLLVLLYVFNIDLSIDLNKEQETPEEDPITQHNTTVHPHSNFLVV